MLAAKENTMWIKALSCFLSKFVHHGSLNVSFPDGKERRYGEPAAEPINIHLSEPSLSRRILLNPELALGEAYMDGTLTIENDDLYGFLELLIMNQRHQPNLLHYRWLAIFRVAIRWFTQLNRIQKSQKNVAHHYDLSGELYDLFLDADRQYSCGYYERLTDTLETAQENKKSLIAKKLLLSPEHTVLDIGSGWGGLSLFLARSFGAKVTGVTLSQEQFNISRARATNQHLEADVQFLLQDYRDVTGQFDRIVSVGMFEHVGVPHHQEYFETLSSLLKPDGVALVHSIGRTDGPGATNPWIAKHIFPGGYSPALSEMMLAIEKSGLCVTDIEVWRLHYAQTLRDWRSRFEVNLDRARQLYDDRFCRMWRFYLVTSELAFQLNGHVVFQVQLAKKQDSVPLTREYLADKVSATMAHDTETISDV